jgi:hypothetical protein
MAGLARKAAARATAMIVLIFMFIYVSM